MTSLTDTQLRGRPTVTQQKKQIGNRPVEEAKKMKCYKRLIYKQFVQVSGVCGPQFLSNLPKRFTHLYRASESFVSTSGCTNIRGTQRQFSENICSEDDSRSRIFGTSAVKFLACLSLLGFSYIYKMVLLPIFNGFLP